MSDDGFQAEQSEYGLDIASIGAWRDGDSIKIGVAEHWSGELVDAKVSLTLAQARELSAWLAEASKATA